MPERLNAMRAIDKLRNILSEIENLSCMPGLESRDERLLNSITAHVLAYAYRLEMRTNGGNPDPLIVEFGAEPDVYVSRLLDGQEVMQ